MGKRGGRRSKDEAHVKSTIYCIPLYTDCMICMMQKRNPQEAWCVCDLLIITLQSVLYVAVLRLPTALPTAQVYDSTSPVHYWLTVPISVDALRLPKYGVSNTRYCSGCVYSIYYILYTSYVLEPRCFWATFHNYERVKTQDWLIMFSTIR